MNQLKKIAIIEPIGLDEKEIKARLHPHEVSYFDSRTMDDSTLVEHLKEVNAILLTNRPLSYQVIKALPKLQLISVAFAGFDHVNPQAVQEKNITVTNASGYANTAVSELTIGLMISLARNIPNNHTNIGNGITTNTGTELKNKTLGIVGFGNIGQMLANLAKAFGMHIISYGPKDSQKDLINLFETSDYISLHLPLNDQTRGMINADLLKHMKKTSYLINCARGPIINQKDLVSALESESIKGAAIDVFDQEPPLSNNEPLLHCKNVITTPHIGFNTEEALVEKATIAINNTLSFFR